VATTDTQPAITVQNVHKRYKDIHALRGVSFSVKRGEIFGLVGANGAGKSTLIRALVGATRPTEGEVRVLGLSPSAQRHELRQQIGYMPQQPALYDDLTARDNLRFYSRAQSIPNLERRIDEVVEFIRLTERRDDPVYGFSGGMKQRVSLACALIHKPQVLFLDEPTAGVDPKLRESFWEHFRTLASEGVTILLSSHQMGEMFLCDRLAIMREGIVLAEDTPRQLLWRGEAQIKIWCGDQLIMETVKNYPDHLPRILQAYQLDPAITRIEIEEDTLETIVLLMIKEREAS
jgi:ABC-2 type transport system ATP-binding protein